MQTGSCERGEVSVPNMAHQCKTTQQQCCDDSATVHDAVFTTAGRSETMQHMRAMRTRRRTEMKIQT